MFRNEKTCSFEIDITFTEITLKSVREDEIRDVEIELLFMGQHIIKSLQLLTEDQNLISNGTHDCDLQFKLINDESELTNEEFNFHILGDPLKVNLVERFDDTKKSLKKLKYVKQQFKHIASGSIDLLDVLKSFQKTGVKIYHLTLNPLREEELELNLQYQTSFANVPNVTWTLALEVSSILNLDLDSGETTEVAFHFPVDNSIYRTAIMQRTQENKEIVGGTGFLTNMSMKDYDVSLNENPTNGRFLYENILSVSGFDNLGEIIMQHGNLLIEIKTKNHTFMTFIELQVFNYEGVKDAIFLEPIYYLNKKIIADKFKQDLSAFTVKENSEKKKTKKSTKEGKEVVVEDSTLLPLLNNNKRAMIMIKMTLSRPQVPEKHLEDMKYLLNQSFPFIENIPSKDRVIAQSEKDFAQSVCDIAKKMEELIGENSNLDNNEMKTKLRVAMDLFNKEQLKKAVKDVIGNKLNVGLDTKNNHEFKISMIRVYKELSRDMMCILHNRKVEEALQPPKNIPIERLRLQAEEWMLMGQPSRAEAIYLQSIKSELNTDVLASFSVFLLRNERYQECAETITNILKINKQSLFSFYFLAYLMTETRKFEVAILCLRILIKMQPENLEFWVLLIMLYLKIEDKLGVDYCTLNMASKKFINNSIDDTKPFLFLELNTEDDFANILNHQLKLGLFHFVKMTREFMSLKSKEFLEPFVDFQLQALEMTVKGKFDEMEELMKNVELTDENETIVRIFKGNFLYDSGKQWEAICEYEIAFNLCLKNSMEFPQMLTSRCAEWFLKAGVFSKARRYYFHHCRKSPTFNTLMGLGAVCFQEMNYLEAEKYFNEANKIYNKSGDNWIYLAICNFHLHCQDSFEKCFQIARKFNVLDPQLMENAERIFDL